MNPTEILTDAFSRIPRLVHFAVEGLQPAQLRERLDPDANPVGWLIWHLTRVEDDHVSEIAGRPQAWVGERWVERFGRPADPSDTGYGHTSSQVGSFDPVGVRLVSVIGDCLQHVGQAAFVRGVLLRRAR